MGRFFIAYAFLLIPFLIINSILTGSFIDSEVVWYNNQHTLGIRIGTIPVEDFFYSMLLMVLTISLMEWLEERAYYKNKWAREGLIQNRCYVFSSESYTVSILWGFSILRFADFFPLDLPFTAFSINFAAFLLFLFSLLMTSA